MFVVMPAQPRQTTPPHIPLKALRTVANISLDTLAKHIGTITGDQPSRGTLSAIETGHRGASTQTLAAIEQVFDLPAGTITTTYQPRTTARRETA